jgi:hypothetical protein
VRVVDLLKIKGRKPPIGTESQSWRTLPLEHASTHEGNRHAAIKAQHAIALGIPLQRGVVGTMFPSQGVELL